MKMRSMLIIILLAGMGVAIGGCKLTPHADIGMDFHINNGKLKVSPNADLGVYGRP